MPPKQEKGYPPKQNGNIRQQSDNPNQNIHEVTKQIQSWQPTRKLTYRHWQLRMKLSYILNEVLDDFFIFDTE